MWDSRRHFIAIPFIKALKQGYVLSGFIEIQIQMKSYMTTSLRDI